MIQAKMAASSCLTSARRYGNSSNFGLRRSPRLRSAALGLLGLLLGALLFAQTLGLMHGLLHAPLTQGAPAVHAHHHEDADHGSSWLVALFAGHEDGSGSCRVLDQQGHSALIPVVASLALPRVLTAPVQTAGIDCLLSAAATPFEARAPPSSFY